MSRLGLVLVCVVVCFACMPLDLARAQVIIPSCAAPQCGQICPFGASYLPATNRCYWHSYGKVQMQSQADGESYCQTQFGGHLASIHSDEEAQFIRCLTPDGTSPAPANPNVDLPRNANDPYSNEAITAYSQLTYIGLMSIASTTASNPPTSYPCVAGHNRGKDQNGPANWAWTDGTPLDYQVWCAQSPNGDGNCIHIPPKNNPTGTWWAGFDSFCSTTMQGQAYPATSWNDIPCNQTESHAELPCSTVRYPTNLGFVCKFQASLIPVACAPGCQCNGNNQCVCPPVTGPCPNCPVVKEVSSSCPNAVAHSSGACVSLKLSDQVSNCQ